MYHSQSQPAAFGLGGEEGGEDLFDLIRGNAAARVGKRDDNAGRIEEGLLSSLAQVRACVCQANREDPFAAPAESVDGISEKI